MQNAARCSCGDLEVCFKSPECIPFTLSFISLPPSFSFSLPPFLPSNSIYNSVSSQKPFLTNQNIIS